MKILKNILFIALITLLTTSCTDNTEDLIINKPDKVENTMGAKCFPCVETGDETDDDNEGKGN